MAKTNIRLLDEIKAIPTGLQGPPCGIATVLAQLDSDDAVDLNIALADPSIEAKAIWRVLIARGFDISHQTLGRHRRGDCRCGRTS